MAGGNTSPPSRNILATIAVGLFLARYFLPTESAAAGETCLIAVAWLLLGAALSYLDWRAGAQWSLDRYDVAIGLLTLPVVLAGLGSNFAALDVRLAQNLTLEWLSLGTSLLVLRRLDQRGVHRTLPASFVSLGVALAIYGVWQHYVWYPSMAEQFIEFERLEALDTPSSVESQRLNELRQTLGPEATSDSATTRAMLRDRLINSTEPLGFFALANTYAGIIAAAGLFVGWSFQTADRKARFVRIACLVVLVVALVLTKSRTAYLAVMAAVAASLAIRFGRSWPWRWIGAAGGGLSLLLIVLIAAGGIDLEVLTEASKSLSYRLEYWRATAGILSERWLTGVGLGNFRPAYLGHKLPGSSEEILDPHNWVLEAWTTAGLVGFIATVGVVTVFGVRNLLDAARSESNEIDVSGRPIAPISIATMIGLIWNGLPVHVDMSVVVVGVIAILVAAVAKWTWRERDLMAASAVVVALLAIHLLASGGYGMPAVTQLWFVCLTLFVVPATRRVAIREGRFHAVHSTLIFAAILGLIFVVQPNLQRERWMAEADARLYFDQQPAAAMKALERAADADLHSPEPWIMLAGLAEQRGDRERVQTATQAALERSPEAPTLKQWAASLLQDIGELDQAALIIRAAALEYPNGSDVHADAAEILSAINDPAASQHAATALELDDLNREAGHTDKVFDPERRSRLETIHSETP